MEFEVFKHTLKLVEGLMTYPANSRERLPNAIMATITRAIVNARPELIRFGLWRWVCRIKN